MSARRSLSRLARIRVFDAAGGVCHLCGQKIHVGERWDVEHVRALSLGGADDESNMRPAHYACHKIKSAEEAPRKAKADRQRAAHLGIRKPSSRPIPGSRASGIRKRMSGEVERWS